MGFYRQFDNFDPLTEKVYGPFSAIQEIADKARKLLTTRSREEIEYAAFFVDWAIENFLKDEIEYGLADLQKQRIARQETIHTLEQQCEEDEYIDHRDFPEIMSDEDFRSNLEDRLVWAFKECYSWHSPSEEDELEFKDGKDYEYFAVLALWLVADAVEADKYSGAAALERAKALGMEMSPEVIQRYEKGHSISDELRSKMLALGIGPLPEYFATPDEIRLSKSGHYAIAAMEAVCFAEHLYEVRQFKNQHEQVKAEIDQMKFCQTIKLEEELTRSNSERGRNAANKRHGRTTHLVKQFAIDLYLKERDVFVSVKEAARLILEDVVDYAKKIETNLLSGVSAFDQVYRWLRVADKNHRKL